MIRRGAFFGTTLLMVLILALVMTPSTASAQCRLEPVYGELLSGDPDGFVESTSLIIGTDLNGSGEGGSAVLFAAPTGQINALPATTVSSASVDTADPFLENDRTSGGTRVRAHADASGDDWPGPGGLDDTDTYNMEVIAESVNGTYADSSTQIRGRWEVVDCGAGAKVTLTGLFESAVNWSEAASNRDVRVVFGWALAPEIDYFGDWAPRADPDNINNDLTDEYTSVGGFFASHMHRDNNPPPGSQTETLMLTVDSGDTFDVDAFLRGHATHNPNSNATIELTISVTPSPEALLDHFKCYVATETERFQPFQVTLADQFGEKLTRVLRPLSVCNPVVKTALSINTTNGAFNTIEEPRNFPEDLGNQAAHLTCYQIRDERFVMEPVVREPGDRRPPFDTQVIRPFQPRHVLVNNQFGEQELTPRRAKSLCVPSLKDFPQGDLDEVEEFLDHFKCYDLEPGESKSIVVNLADQFHESGQVAAVLKPVSLCNPVVKTHVERTGSFPEDLNKRDAHLTCYEIRDLRRVPDENGTKVKQNRFTPRNVLIENQFGEQELRVKRPETICLPSLKDELGNGMTQIDPP